MIQIRWTWAMIPLFVTVIALQTCALVQRAGRAERAEQAAEAAGMRVEGLVAEQRSTERQLRDALEDADGLRDQIARAPRGSTPREVVKWKTKSVEIPIPSPPCDGSSPPHHEPGPSSPAVPAPFSVRLEGTEARLETRQGTLFAVGEVSIVQTEPPPEKLLATLPWDARMTTYQTAAPAARRRVGWGVGPAVGLVDGSWVYGAAATGPALGGRVALQPAAWALAGEGHWTGAGAVLVTW